MEPGTNCFFLDLELSCWGERLLGNAGRQQSGINLGAPLQPNGGFLFAQEQMGGEEIRAARRVAGQLERQIMSRLQEKHEGLGLCDDWVLTLQGGKVAVESLPATWKCKC